MATVFEISANMAMFRKPYTTTSSISYAFPPPTAIAGLICAIVGISNGSHIDSCSANYWEKLKGTKVSLSICSNLEWMRHSINFWNVKNPKKSPHIQVKHQFLRNPKYRIFVAGGIEPSLRHQLEKGYFVYTPYLGVAYALANINYIGTYDSEKVNTAFVTPDTVVPWCDDLKLGNVVDMGGVFKEQVPFQMDNRRALMKSISVLYPPTSETKVSIIEKGSLDVTRCGEHLVAWFPEW